MLPRLSGIPHLHVNRSLVECGVNVVHVVSRVWVACVDSGVDVTIVSLSNAVKG